MQTQTLNSTEDAITEAVKSYGALKRVWVSSNGIDALVYLTENSTISNHTSHCIGSPSIKAILKFGFLVAIHFIESEDVFIIQIHLSKRWQTAPRIEA